MTDEPVNPPGFPIRDAKVDALALRLRQSVQGCTLHIQGPVQAWRAVHDARAAGEIVSQAVVGERVVAECRAKLEELADAGVAATDPSVRKEVLTMEFITALFSL